ncbi:TIR domain-containing protein [Lysinibacillus sp. NPDC048646]|uniref:TIR domain-containing protein n=1 Tax=Lysinibacillus sp. NPDC048646 TaxID=3390574 RepID=UPI003D055CBC
MHNISMVLELKRLIADVKSYQGEWRRSDDFERFVAKLNKLSKEIDLPTFEFEPFHYSSTRKTINDNGFVSLTNHLDILEEALNLQMKNNNSKAYKESKDLKQKVFVVHGRDSNAVLEVESILNRANLEPIVLHRGANNGLTLIEKFEKYSNVDYAIVILTPDDIGALYTDGPLTSLDLKFRARQNVLFELGFFFGKLGRAKVCCLIKNSVEKPSDIDGIVYMSYQNSIEEIELALLKELKEADLHVKIL